MSQQELNGAQVGPGFEQVGCETVPKRMGRDRFDNAATVMRLLARMLYRRLADMPTDLIAGKSHCLGLVTGHQLRRMFTFPSIGSQSSRRLVGWLAPKL
jgi:hypothetical protein